MVISLATTNLVALNCYAPFPRPAVAPWRLGKVLGRLPQWGGNATRFQFSRDGHLATKERQLVVAHWYHMYIYICIIYICIIYICTSSTAQGGGGSFKNRKPIGEIGCCESGMAERSHWWTERCLISLTLSLSFSDYLPAYQPIFYVSTYLSHYLSF